MASLRSRAAARVRPRVASLRSAVRHLGGDPACSGCRIADAVADGGSRRGDRGDLWHRLARETGERRVRILVTARDARVATALAAVVSPSTVTTLDPDADDWTDRLTSHGPVDVVLDLGDHAKSAREVFTETLFALGLRGLYLLDGATADAWGDGTSARETLAELLEVRERRVDKSLRRAHRGSASNDRVHLARSIAEVEDRPAYVAVHKQQRSLAKLDERRADLWLDAAGGRRGRVLLRHPAAPVPRLGDLHENESPRADRFSPEEEAPAPTLREYLAPVCQPGQVVTGPGVLLPDTYRHITRRRLINRYVVDLAHDWGRPVAPPKDPEPLPGTFYYLDSEFRGHFGHAMTEQVSRFWGWRHALELDPDVKALVGTNAGRTELAPFELELFGAAGIEPDRIHVISGPVVPERLIAGTPLFGNPRYVHPRIVEEWTGLSDRLAERAPEGDRPRRLFCSRRTVHTAPGTFKGQRRVCHNGAEVEDWFRARGFTVVFTEDYTMAEQAALFRGAEMVAGYAGSALFNLAFATHPIRVVLISSESYTAQNEFLIASALGHEVHTVYCPADIPRRPREWSSAAFNSAFTVDLERDADFLERAVS